MASRSSVTRATVGVTNALLHNPERLETARTAVATERIAYFVQKTLAEAPPLTEAQRARIANLLAGGADDE